MKSKVAVIMSVYNSDNHIHFKEAVESIISQSYKCDLFICRDGVVDKLLQREIDKYKSYDNVFISENSHNSGLAVVLNQLIDKVINLNCYDYVARMDSDDISDEFRIFEQVSFMESNSLIGVSGSFCSEFGASYALPLKTLPCTHEELKSFSISRCPFIHPTVIFRIDVFQAGFRYPEDTALTEDMALWFVLLSNNILFANVNKPLLKYRLSESTINRRRSLSKGINELSLRFRYMKILNGFNFFDVLRVSSRLFFHVLPLPALKFLYKNCR